MKRNVILSALVLGAFLGASCEKHRWNDEVVEIEEKIYNEDGDVVETVKTKVIKEKGAVRFFKENHSGDHAKQHTSNQASTSAESTH